MSFVLETRNLKKYFGNTVKAVDDVSIALERGRVIGLIGANGAGKTTLMRMLVTLEVPDSGTIIIEGVDMMEYPEKVLPHIGWMPDDVGVVEEKKTTVLDYLDFFARAYGLMGDERRNKVQETLTFVGILDLSDRFVNKLSKGQTQRLSLARTLVGNPSVLVLDEPAAGLDPKARIEFKQLVHALAQQGKTLMISSHILSELSEMCDYLIFMDNGKVIRHGGKDEFMQDVLGQSEFVYEITCPTEAVGEVANWLQAREAWKDVSVNGNVVTACVCLQSEMDVVNEVRALNQSVPVLECTRKRATLEQAFVSILTEQ